MTWLWLDDLPRVGVASLECRGAINLQQTALY